MRIINLLPKPRQQLLRDEAIFHSLLIFIWISLFGFGIVVLSQFGVRVYLQTEAQSVQASIDQLNIQVKKGENSNLKTQITQLNNFIADYKSLSDASPKWSKVIKAFSVLPPNGVLISSFTIDFAKNTIYITGSAPTRELVIQLYNNILSDDKEFYNIDYPLENVAKATNVSFHFTFNIRPSLIK